MLRKSSSRWLNYSLTRLVLTGLVILSCIGGISALQVPRLRALQDQNSTLSNTQIQRQEEAEKAQLAILKQFPTFGFDNLISDWVFLDFIQYFGDTPTRLRSGYGLSPDYFDVILSRDPYFLEGYFFLSASSSLFAGMPERTIEIFDRELPHLSPNTPDRSYYVWRYKGIDELLFLGDSDAARQSFETAAEWASVYGDPESQSVERISRQMAEFLAQNPDSRRAQISAWIMVYYNALNKETQDLAIQNIERLGGQVSIRDNGFLDVEMPSID